MKRSNIISREKICAVIVTFHPDSVFISRLKSILREFVFAVVVDNASQEDSLSMLKSITNNNVKFIFNEENYGVAKALNQGVQWAKENNYQYIITFDQDSCVKEGICTVMCNIWNGLNFNVGVMGLNHIDENSKKTYFKNNSSKNKSWIFRKTVITAGSLINIITFNHIGLFREKFFIDGVDHEFCLRARSKGCKVIMILEPLLAHAMGNRRLHHVKLLTKRISLETTNYTPQRWYYMARNRMILVMEYFLKDTWAISRAIYFVGSVIIMIIFEKKRLVKLGYIFLGLWDSLTAKYDRKLL